MNVTSPGGRADAISFRFHNALKYASEMHAFQTRKGTRIPYISHALSVCAMVWEAGGTEEEAIAALLHDGPEDQGGLARLADIRDRFGNRVAEIVEHCSDTFESPKPPWSERKRAYVERLASADESVLLVSVADKLHNALATLRDLENASDLTAFWQRFNASPNAIVDNYSALVRAYTVAKPDPRRV